jgi:hypothetical protein
MSAFKTWWTAFKSLINPLALFITNERGLFPSDDSQSRTRITTVVAKWMFFVSWILWTIYAIFLCHSYQEVGFASCIIGSMWVIYFGYLRQIKGEYALKLGHYVLMLSGCAAILYLIGHFVTAPYFHKYELAMAAGEEVSFWKGLSICAPLCGMFIIACFASALSTYSSNRAVKLVLHASALTLAMHWYAVCACSIIISPCLILLWIAGFFIPEAETHLFHHTQLNLHGSEMFK